FVHDKKQWILKQLDRMEGQVPVKKSTIQHGDEYLYLGETLKLDIGNYKAISVTKTLNFPTFLEFRIDKELPAWYIAQSKKLITERVEYYSRLMKLPYKSIYFSDTISKWGSCS